MSQIEQTLEQLRAGEQRWRAVFESDLIGVVLRDRQNRVIECNEAYAAMCDAPNATALIGTDFAALLEPGDALRAAEGFPERWSAGPSPEQHIDRDYTLRSGRKVRIHATTSVVRDAAGRALYELALIEDRTEQRRLEDELARTRRIQELGRLAGGVAHDVNNMLAVIIGYTEIVAGRLGPGHELQAELAEIIHAAEHSRALARDLLAFGRQQVLDRQPLVPGVIVSGLGTLLRHLVGEAIELVIRDESAGSVCIGDLAQLETVIVNLAANARDAMPEGGRVTIHTSVRPPSDGAARPYVTIAVSDTGEGMTEEVQQSIFEPFFTTKAPGHGTGLGLASVAGIVEQMGGEITVRSQPAAGSTFIVALPCDQPAAAGEGQPQSPEPAGPGRTVLVVEDQDQVRGLVERLLSGAGYQVLSAPGGRAALDVLGDGRQTVDLLLTDMVLPDLPGGELARLALELRPGLPIIYTSGYAGDTVAREGMPRGEGFLAKPYGSAELRQVLDAAFRAAP